MNLKIQIEKLLKQSYLLKQEKIQETLETPPDPSFGDLATNICFSLSKKIKKSPQEIAKQIVSELKIPKDSIIEKVGMKAGYVNFFFNYEKLAEGLLKTILIGKEKYGCSDLGKNKKYMVEFAHPNTHKPFHIGHLRNISIGESIIRILESTGHRVIRTNYQGDVGLHIAKCLYGILKIEDYKKHIENLKTTEEKIDFLSKCYVTGNKAYEEDEEAKETIKDINYLIYASAQKFNQEERGIEPSSTDYMKFVRGRELEIDKVYELWKKTRQWSLDYFEKIYKRVYSHFDRYYFESECLVGVDLAKKATEKGILKESQGAVIFDGEPYGLDTRVFVNRLGLPTYEGKELKLADIEFSEFGKIDKCIHVVGPEQISFFKIMFKVEELLNPEKFKDKQFHLIYGWVRLKEGKMSSRFGNVILAEDVIDEAKNKLKEHLKGKKEYSKEQTEDISEKVAIGATKYSMLKISTSKEISFDIDESISFEGDSGPYLQYAHVRADKILQKSGGFKETFKPKELTTEEKELIKKLLDFPEIVEKSAKDLKPNYICNYAHELAEIFSTFYHSCPVIQSEGELKNFRLTLVKAFKITLKNCLNLLGIETPEVM